MTYSLSLRPRALAEIKAARDRYMLVGHGDSFLDELDAVIDVIQAMPLRFPVVCGSIHRALLRRDSRRMICAKTDRQRVESSDAKG